MESVMDTVLKVIYGLITLGILVLVHELGHYIAGKACGIRVIAFSIGFGRGIISFEHKGTLYKIGWLPIGGYCRFAGEGEDLSDDRKGAPDEMYARPAWARLITVSAGIIFNFAFAILIFFILSLTGYGYQSNDNTITVLDKSFLPEDERFPALESGLQTGDRILSVNGVETESYRRIMEEIGVRPDQDITITADRAGKTLELRAHTMIRDTGMGAIGVFPFYPAIVQEIEEESPAAAIGLIQGDRILSWNNETVDSLHRLRLLIAQSQDAVVPVVWEREGQIMRAETAAMHQGNLWILGLKPPDPEIFEYALPGLPLGQAFLRSFEMFGENIARTVQGVKLLFRKEVDTSKALAGPVRIVQFSGEVMKESSAAGYLTFLAIISIALGFFNLLPIPAADGGHIVLNIIEMIRRKPFSFAVLQRIQMAGVIILMTIFVFVLTFDIMSIIA
ncbi:MAG: RIP metalloprotease RseP [Spirochaetota bacterium]|jgi:regulator of sigma E protease|nr:RIP metalloprotease RseP [Spirochaetota bacterium]